MPPFLLNKRLIILLVCIIVLVALVGLSLNDRRNLSWPEVFVKDVVGWTQYVVQSPLTGIGQVVDNIQDLRNTYEENKLLKSRMDEFSALAVKAAAFEKENQELRSLLDKEESLSNYSAIQAEVIGRNPDRWHELITINRGSQNGVEENMAVMTAQGVIGQIRHVEAFTSTVQLLSSTEPSNVISAVVQGNENVFGLIEGFDEDQDMLRFAKITTDRTIEKGATVITSGLGGNFPKGLVIGEVTDVVPDEYGLTQTAFVKPATDFYDISHVMVINPEINPVSPDEVTGEEG
ncbi:rod shape-determining protein MreC [Aureibacillus halotolerans]|uniref:Cell shape-determining protein MreC n=1 Tax=Aureibacillus halotolerans TaxID=1508390 RepID=A0A4R6TWU5_9BACI|nr:rod shape-determining protein MreC [Aureibacillus halotolerans]TDQ37961.1 rod shape-determining protein MreC [Aureibacillus halotolerans]